MRVSAYYHLGRTQPTLDFVDVDIRGDARVFIDPRALRLLPSEWGHECVALIQHFFREVLHAIHEGRNSEARSLLRVLREPNETHLGLSIEQARGKGLGPLSSGDVWTALSRSEAAQSGLLEDLEDTVLMVEGISSDIVSDITTNIIREPLIEYTQAMATYYGIPLVDDVASGPLWNPTQKRWYSKYVRLPVTNFGKLLMVPKVIVRTRMEYDVDEYYRHYLLEYLREIELKANSELVQLLKNGMTRVTKKALMEKYGTSKADLIRETLRYPQILQRYRDDKSIEVRPPLSHYNLAETEGTPLPDWDVLYSELEETPIGQQHFSRHEKAVESLLTALFYPALTNPQVQTPLHNGRKRVDITYLNVATHGFFYWLGMHYPAPLIFVECKNYGRELGNPDLDQLAGRFSPSRGQFGIIICRNFEDKDLFIQRCKDTAMDNRGFIIPLDDHDIENLVIERKENSDQLNFALLTERLHHLIM